MADELIYKPRLDPRASKFALKLRRSRIHRFGIFAMEDISRRKRVIEYTGNGSADAHQSSAGGGVHLYLHAGFLLGDRRSGQRVRGEIINHSCEPNLEAHIIAGRRIYYVSQRAIRAGEELTVDYSFDTNQDPQECHCGARACRGDMRRPLNSRESRLRDV